MSQWQNPSWPTHNQPSTLARSGEKQDQYPYTLPNQKYTRHPFMPAEFDPAQGDHHQYTSRPPSNHMPHPADPPQPSMGGVPFPQPGARPGVANDVHFPQMGGGPHYTAPPASDYPNHTNFQVPAELWDPLALGTHGQDTGGGAKKQSRSGLVSSDPSSATRSSSSTAGSAHGRLESVSGQKVTKRSRMGCLTCRQRKKRCCESRPKCLECQRLRLNCQWPKPGTEHKNKPKEVKSQENMIDHDVYGKIKVLRGIVEYRSS